MVYELMLKTWGASPSYTSACSRRVRRFAIFDELVLTTCRRLANLHELMLKTCLRIAMLYELDLRRRIKQSKAEESWQPNANNDMQGVLSQPTAHSHDGENHPRGSRYKWHQKCQREALARFLKKL